ncbi:MAG: symmetrical bis(5'-nucleosyl)-tetraphosphatase [Pseudomonadota bacterium]
MAVYAIGDIQGCAHELRQLLEALAFDPQDDQLWCCGDLVNRGPDSLATLRLIKSLGSSAITVLGNHDLHLLAVAAGVRANRPHKGDTFEAILDAPDRDDLIGWLRTQPLAHYDDQVGWLMIHAGLPPQWTSEEALQHAGQVSDILKSPEADAWLAGMYGNEPSCWRSDLARDERLRFTVNCLTRMRYCSEAGALQFKAKGPPGSQPAGLMPWFEVPDRRSRDTAIVFGHWSTLGLQHTHNVLSLDTGCVWGGSLTAARLSPLPLDFTEVACAGER